MVTVVYKYPDFYKDIMSHTNAGFIDMTGSIVSMPGPTNSQLSSAQVQHYFELGGLPFPNGSRLTINTNNQTLILKNTANNQDLFQRMSMGLDSGEGLRIHKD